MCDLAEEWRTEESRGGEGWVSGTGATVHLWPGLYAQLAETNTAAL